MLTRPKLNIVILQGILLPYLKSISSSTYLNYFLEKFGDAFQNPSKRHSTSNSLYP